jgi:hypothetical protein
MNRTTGADGPIGLPDHLLQAKHGPTRLEELAGVEGNGTEPLAAQLIDGVLTAFLDENVGAVRGVRVAGELVTGFIVGGFDHSLK